MKKNRYSRALKILKSTEVDDKIKSLNEMPTNHTTGLYALNDPGFRLGDQDPRKVYYPAADGTWPEGIPGTPGELEYVRPKGYWSGGSDWNTQITTDFSQDYLENDPTGRSTEGLIGSDGTVFSDLPPDSRGFILGPIIDGFIPNHTSDAYTNIGYLQKDTRQFVLLARIRGQWKDGLNGSVYPVWNGTSTGLTIYNENMTLEMVQWIKDQVVSDNYVSKVPYFYSGGVPQVPQSPADCPNCPPGMYGGNGIAPRQFGEGGSPSIGTQQVPPRSGDAKDAGYPWGKDKKKKEDEDIKKELEMYAALLQRAYDSQYAAATQQAAVFAIPIGIGAWNAAQVLVALIAAYGLSEAKKMIIERGLEDSYRGAIEALKSSELSDDQWEKNAERGRQRDAAAAKEASERQRKADEELKKAKESGNKERIKRAEEEQRNADKNMERVQKQNAENRRQRSNARRKRGLQGQGGMREELGMYGDSYNPQGQVLAENRKRILREIKQPYKLPEIPKQKYKMNFSGKYSPQNTPDKTSSELSDALVASGNARGQKWRLEDHYWQGYETTERMNIIQDRIGHGQQAWDMIVNENKNKKTWRDQKIQEHLNIIAHEKAMKEENPDYKSPFSELLDEQETIEADKDPLFKKVVKRLKKEIDYADKPSKNGDPNEPPPEMVNGYHPNFGKRVDYYRKLDPQSASAMPPTGDPEIDKKVRAAAKKPK